MANECIGYCDSEYMMLIKDTLSLYKKLINQE